MWQSSPNIDWTEKLDKYSHKIDHELLLYDEKKLSKFFYFMQRLIFKKKKTKKKLKVYSIWNKINTTKEEKSI